MENRLNDIRKRMYSDSRELAYWKAIRKDLKNILKNPTPEEYEDWKSDWGLSEILEMTIMHLEYELEQETK